MTFEQIMLFLENVGKSNRIGSGLSTSREVISTQVTLKRIHNAIWSLSSSELARTRWWWISRLHERRKEMERVPGMVNPLGKSRSWTYIFFNFCPDGIVFWFEKTHLTSLGKRLDTAGIPLNSFGDPFGSTGKDGRWKATVRCALEPLSLISIYL